MDAPAMPSLTFVMPQWLYWAGLIAFPAIFLEEIQGDPARIGQVPAQRGVTGLDDGNRLRVRRVRHRVGVDAAGASGQRLTVLAEPSSQ